MRLHLTSVRPWEEIAALSVHRSLLSKAQEKTGEEGQKMQLSGPWMAAMDRGAYTYSVWPWGKAWQEWARDNILRLKTELPPGPQICPHLMPATPV